MENCTDDSLRGLPVLCSEEGWDLLVDEFGLLLTMEFGLKGNYWAPQSYYAIVVATSIFALFLFFLRAD